jgi:hypothetical protein
MIRFFFWKLRHWWRSVPCRGEPGCEQDARDPECCGCEGSGLTPGRRWRFLLRGFGVRW